MRNGYEWCVALLLLSGCGGAPADRPAGSAGPGPAAVQPADTLPAASARAGEGPSPAVQPDRLSALAARRFLAAHREALVLDVRNPDEWNDDLGHLDGARLIPLPELSARLAEIEGWKERPVVVVCRAGGRSHEAARMLREAGFAKAMNLEGGLLAWRASEKVEQLAH